MANSKPVAHTVRHVLAELGANKRLLAFALLQSGASQADGVGVAQSRISRIFTNGVGDGSLGRGRR
jgi:hypothetical protein